MSRRSHFLLQLLAAAALLALVAGVAGVLVVRSGWFRERIRERIVSVLENATGARVELANFNFDWPHFSVSVAPLILHGKEGAGEPVLARLDSVTLGLRVISPLERRVDLALLRIRQPQIHIIIYPDGSTNLPRLARPAGGNLWSKDLIDIAVQHYEVSDGLVQVDARRYPLQVSGDDLTLAMDYQAAATGLATYRGTVSSRRITFATEQSAASASLSGDFTLGEQNLEIRRLRLASGRSRVDLQGALSDLREPKGKFAVRGVVAASDVNPWLEDSAAWKSTAPMGNAAFEGDFTMAWGPRFDYTLTARVNTRDAEITLGPVNVPSITLTGLLRARPGNIAFENVTGSALDTNISGKATLAEDAAKKWRTHAEGNFEELNIRDVGRILTDRPFVWNGWAQGNFSTDAEAGNAKVDVTAEISPRPGAGGVPLEGHVGLHYDQASGAVRFEDTQLATPETNVTVAGALGPAQGMALNIRAETKNMDDVAAALKVLLNRPPASLPLKLLNGQASAAGVISGPLSQIDFRGQFTLRNAQAEGHAVERFTGQVHANGQVVELTRMTFERGAARITGSISDRAAPGEDNGGFENGALSGQLNFAGLQLAEADREFGIHAGLTGTAAGNVQLGGTPRNPEAEIVVEAAPLSGYGQKADRLKASGRYTPGAIEVRAGEASLGANRITFSGAYHHPENDWSAGELRGDFATQGLPTEAIPWLRQWQPEATARLDGKFDFAAQLEHGAISLRGLNGNGAARAVTYRGAALGDVSLTAATHERAVQWNASAHLRESTVVTGQGQVQLDGMNAGSGKLRFSRMSVNALHDLVAVAAGGKAPALPPFDGSVEGGATFSLPLRDPRAFQAEVTLDALEFRPRASQVLRLDVKEQDLQVRNSGPIVVDLNAQAARIRAARFTARETNLEVTGQLPFSTSLGGADFNVRGGVNLAILQLLNPDLLAKGTATVAAAVRGSLLNPALNGRMELMNASLYLADVPNGVDKTNGVILFDRNRATIERLSAETGGGQIAFHGSLEFGSTLVYRLQAEARQVRVRYPADMSITASAQLSLTGTSENSTLTGTLELSRAAAAAGADLGRLIAVASQPTPAPPEPNEYLRGMRFDVRVQSTPQFTLETSLTRDIQTEVDLRLRGTPLAPALVGTISASSGELQLFGNRYTVNRGEVRFLNPVKIEPLLDLDLETRARGIEVNVTITGSPQKLNVNYSSDPPLQPREIIALLSVGRDPTAITENSTAATSATGLGDAGGLLGEAVSEQLSNRLQRFFGSSRVKIDPTLTGVDTLPSATYLTLQQQVSRDVTLIYTTNLNRTQEQIVRVEWDLNPQWSAVAVRDANGLFGVDFQYRKRFK